VLGHTDCVIGDLDVLRTYLSTALCDVTHSKTMLFLCGALAVLDAIQWVHIKLCDTDKESWARK
jgi:hypothetical protein